MVAVYLNPGRPPKGGCAAASADALTALGLIAGRPAAGRPGTEILADGLGIVRSRWAPGADRKPREIDLVSAEARYIVDNPIQSVIGGRHEH